MFRPATVVAVPARDEADRIIACLQALLDQRDRTGCRLGQGSLKVLVLANNCRDGTADAARGFGDAVEVVEAELPPTAAHAGIARRAAMDAAAARLPGGGLLCTTDADSRPRPDWIVRLWAALADGAEAVAGAVDLEPAEGAPLVFSEGRRAEGLYSALQAEINARIDPEPHNPWPNHIWAWGANMAVTASAYRRVGGLPPRPLAEDRAFLERLRRHDVPVRHCLEARVWTSARRAGRAKGGLASLVDNHLRDDAEPCDAALEPACLAGRRAAWRARLRRGYLEGGAHAELAAKFHLPSQRVTEALHEQTFGAAWAMIEAASPRLRPRRLALADLPREIARAERLLSWLDAPADPAGRARAASAGLWTAPALSG